MSEIPPWLYENLSGEVKRLVKEIDDYSADATIGSPKLITINDVAEHLKHQAEVEHLKLANNEAPSEEKRLRLFKEEIINEQIQREIMYRKVSIPGYADEYVRLFNIISQLRTTPFNEGGTQKITDGWIAGRLTTVIDRTIKK